LLSYDLKIVDMNGTVIDTMLFLNQNIEKNYISIHATENCIYVFREIRFLLFHVKKCPHEGSHLNGKN